MFGMPEKEVAGLAELKLGLILIIDRLENIYLMAKHDHTCGTNTAKLLIHTPVIVHDIWNAIIERYDEGDAIEFSDGWPNQTLAERTREFLEDIRNEFRPFGYLPGNITEEDGVTIKPKVFNDLRLKIAEDHKSIDMPVQLDMLVEQVIKSIDHFSNINPT